MSSASDSNKPASEEVVKMIEKAVYRHMKPLGFRKHGRLLHRFVDGDISQVICFESDCKSNGAFDVLWIHLGIRIPECQMRKFVIPEPDKKYYHIAYCNLRSGLRGFHGTEEPGTWFVLHRNEPQEIIDSITDQLNKDVIPAFEALSNRNNILQYKEKYAHFYEFSSRVRLLEEAMIWGRKGDVVKATHLFHLHYQNCLAEYNDAFENGKQQYMYRGDTISYFNPKTQKSETVTAPRDGYYTLFCADRGHLNYLEQLAKELGISIF